MLQLDFLCRVHEQTLCRSLCRRLLSYGHCSVIHGDYMYFFGGDDGDHVRSPSNYNNRFYNDLWRFDLKAKTWKLLTKEDHSKNAVQPKARSIFAMDLIGDEIVLCVSYKLLPLGHTHKRSHNRHHRHQHHHHTQARSRAHYACPQMLSVLPPVDLDRAHRALGRCSKQSSVVTHTRPNHSVVKCALLTRRCTALAQHARVFLL